MASSSSSSSSDESRQEKRKKRKKKQERSPNQDRKKDERSSGKTKNHRDNRDGRENRDNKDSYRPNREVRREADDNYRERSQRDRDREYRENRREHHRKEDERQNDKRKHDRSPMRREDARSRHREYDDRGRRNRDPNDHPKRRDDGPFRQKKSSFEEARVKQEPSPEWGKPVVKAEGKPKQDKEKPNFELSGKLTEDANTVNGVIIKYAEPGDARKPKRRWRLYPFKGEKALPTLYIHRQSAYLMGRDRKVADIPLDHPSCSKQHAALQYRLVSYQKEGGGEGRRVRPYLIDLESANGTFVNNVKLEPRRYHELLERDVVRFGFSTREYVLLHEHSKDEALDDDVPPTSTA